MSRAIPVMSALAACIALAGCSTQREPASSVRPATTADTRPGQHGAAGGRVPGADKPMPMATGQGDQSARPSGPATEKGGLAATERPDVSPTPATPSPTATATEKAKSKKKRPLHDLVEKVPGVDRVLPDWAIPIVADVEKRTAPGTTAEAVMAGDTLVVSATVKLPPGLVRAASLVATPDKAATRTVDMVMTVEDPATATPEDPATVTVTAVDTEEPTAEPVTVTAEVTAPATVDTVAADTVATAVEDAATQEGDHPASSGAA
ncbi:hypothetical protein [Streptomyces sp. URMC 124]|uniref:hypothetical protein n=1 Tax=Streptomyces sp. URMC 124 TaxID=3423405 RepID=UPI003F1B01B7